MTNAQQQALVVLCTYGRVRGSKRRTTMGQPPNVNMIAAGGLVKLGLARCINPDIERGYVIDSGITRGMVHDDSYEPTQAGLDVRPLVNVGDGGHLDNLVIGAMSRLGLATPAMIVRDLAVYGKCTQQAVTQSLKRSEPDYVRPVADHPGVWERWPPL